MGLTVLGVGPNKTPQRVSGRSPLAGRRLAFGPGRLALVGAVLLGLWATAGGSAQVPPNPTPQAPTGPQQPAGVDVMARGPVHEAFATPTAEPNPTMKVSRKPPVPLDEMPPEDRPEGDMVWIGGYYAWDDDRTDYLWVSGCWRTKPPGKDWVAGYWREADNDQWQWVPGFWTAMQPPEQPNQPQGQAPAQAAGVTYYPEPPTTPNVALPPRPVGDDVFFVPGNWSWNGDRYVWRSGFWTRVQPNYVWIQSHYRWTPSGYVYIAGYWDVGVARRGMLYAPVVVDYNVVGATYVYTPAYAVSDTLVMDTMFVRPVCCHYYFGDYYEPRYRTMGFESCYVYSQRNYDAIVVYRSYEYRNDPTWISVQIDLGSRRERGLAPVPPRTLVQQTTIVNNVTNVTNINNTTVNKTVNNTVNNTNINNNTTINKTTTNNQFAMLAPASQVAAAKGMKTVPVDNVTRVAAKQQAQTLQQTAIAQRKQTEHVPPGTAAKPLTAPRAVAMNVPPTKAAAALPSVANPHGVQQATPTPSHTNNVQNTQAGHPTGTVGATNTNVKPAVQPTAQPNTLKPNVQPHPTVPTTQQPHPAVTQPPRVQPPTRPAPPAKKDEKDKKTP